MNISDINTNNNQPALKNKAVSFAQEDKDNQRNSKRKKSSRKQDLNHDPFAAWVTANNNQVFKDLYNNKQ